ncbi:MAG TPA: signal recognition particle-docking protein FtsY [Candidatus Binataceae bacterium]|nr:signal recognition particle-docking protein FtsY [Candidatus Binataceae bacterium]
MSEPVFLLSLAAGVEAVLLLVASLIEFSVRKRRRIPAPPAETVEAVEAAPLEPQVEAEAVGPITAPAVEPPAPPAPEIVPVEPVVPPDIAPPPMTAEPAAEARLEPRPAVEPEPPAAPDEVPEAAAVPEPVSTLREAPAPAFDAAAPVEPARRIGLGLRRTREGFLARMRAVFTSGAKLDEIYEGLEEALIGADVGVEVSLRLVEAVRGRLKSNATPEQVREALKDEIAKTLTLVERPTNIPVEGPFVVMLAGVNGAGKTTTVAKLAARMKAERGPVIVAAADTFRAAAIEQLEIWCKRAGAEIIKQMQGSDPAAVAFDAVKAAVARDAGTVIIDTAGRLQTRVNLMEELKKIARVVGREMPGAPHECWLVLDATTGQNALSQAKVFGEAVPLTGVVLAKLDSTAKGGVVIAIADQLKLPVRFVGLGENIEDLREFDSREFVEALFSEDESRADNASGSYAA